MKFRGVIVTHTLHASIAAGICLSLSCMTSPPTTGHSAGALDAASEVWRTLNVRLDGGQPLTPEFVDLLCRASENIAAAERADAGETTALSNHLARLDQLDRQFASLHDGPAFTSRIIAYYRAAGDQRLQR